MFTGTRPNSIVDRLLVPYGPVTLGSDYRTILKSDPILLILRSVLDVPILKIDKFAVRPSRFIGADFVARKMRQSFILRWSYDDRTMIASQKHCLATFQKIGTDLRTGSQTKKSGPTCRF